MAYVYTFGSTIFSPTASDRQPMVGPPGFASSVRHVPYSSFNVLDKGGLTERHFKAEVRIAPDKIGEWEALLGTTAALTVAGVVWPSATLIALGDHSMSPRGEWHFYSPEWIL